MFSFIIIPSEAKSLVFWLVCSLVAVVVLTYLAMLYGKKAAAIRSVHGRSFKRLRGSVKDPGSEISANIRDAFAAYSANSMISSAFKLLRAIIFVVMVVTLTLALREYSVSMIQIASIDMSVSLSPDNFNNLLLYLFPVLSAVLYLLGVPIATAYSYGAGDRKSVRELMDSAKGGAPTDQNAMRAAVRKPARIFVSAVFAIALFILGIYAPQGTVLYVVLTQVLILVLRLATSHKCHPPHILNTPSS